MLTDKTIVIIGGSSGIGYAAARMAYASGARVVIAGRSQEKLQAAAEAVGSGVRTFAVEIANEASVAGLFSQLSHVDHLFITASDVVLGPILDTDSSRLQSTMDSRFWGSYYAAKHAAPRMRLGGSITFMSGTASQRPSPGGAVAAASGAAVESLGRTLALELAPIRVNTISAGAVDTPLLDVFFGEQRAAVVENLTHTLPVRRMGAPEDVAEAALYLMSNAYTTGTVLSVDGGILLI
ncbi:SDR family oxidoreductase [Paenibacillus sp. FJAT-26967]|uniref:SDR family oxidoreductase n=1 Tax=Paenibacillus sp. FJAT-26967 TaxID=1729690 RepID=UPI00083989FA|nr:SDR family oxidoreductase [Paenibacillus sp. FJAT-26967]